MEEKYKVTFIDNVGDAYQHLILTRSQVKLLDYLYQIDDLRDGFNYIVEDDAIEWEEIK